MDSRFGTLDREVVKMKCDELKAISNGEIYNMIEYEGYCETNDLYYLKSEADNVIAELKKEIESMKVKFREFNDNVCRKIVNASRTMSEISQDAQMDFYEEFIKNEVNNG